MLLFVAEEVVVFSLDCDTWDDEVVVGVGRNDVSKDLGLVR